MKLKYLSYLAVLALAPVCALLQVDANPQPSLGTFTWKGGNIIAANDLQGFQNEILKRHNEYRAKHGVPPLQLDANLNKAAQQWANTLASTQQFKHSGVSGQGENLYVAGATQQPPMNVESDNSVDSWYNEIKEYNYRSPGFSSKTGHFTQVVWKSSTKLGCGIASGKFQGYNGWYVVCRYTPQGNVSGQFAENVPQPRK